MESKLQSDWFWKASTENNFIFCNWVKENCTSLCENLEWGLRESDSAMGPCMYISLPKKCLPCTTPMFCDEHPPMWRAFRRGTLRGESPWKLAPWLSERRALHWSRIHWFQALLAENRYHLFCDSSCLFSAQIPSRHFRVSRACKRGVFFTCSDISQMHFVIG